MSGDHDYWRKVEDELPDADMSVLIALAKGEVEAGYFDGEVWRFENGVAIGYDENYVTRWSHYPCHPDDA